MSANLSAAALRSASLPSALSCRAGQPQYSAAGKLSDQISEMMACTGCQDSAAEQHADQVVLLDALAAQVRIVEQQHMDSACDRQQ